jgi:hypothetical protein
MAKKTALRVNPKTRAVEKIPAPPHAPPPEELPKPEPVRLEAGIRKDGDGIPAAEPVKLALAPAAALKLDLACGQSPRDGFEGVDLSAPNVKHRVDLLKFPWPWKDDSAEELFCSHFVEHISAREVEERDLAHVDARSRSFLGQDMFLAFFDECWRILKEGGKMTVACPAARNDRAFQDPTHRRFIVAQSFLYLWKKWRVDNKLDHYRVSADFDFNVDPTLWIQPQCCTHHQAAPTSARPQEVQSKELAHYWNVVVDWQVTMTARKGR